MTILANNKNQHGQNKVSLVPRNTLFCQLLKTLVF